MLSLFYIVLALAAGSNGSPCTPSNSSSAPATGDSAPATNEKAAVQQAGTGSNIVLNSGSGDLGSVSGPLQYSQSAPVSNTTATASAPSAASSTASAGGSTASGAATSGSCPAGFINTVFNTNAPKNGGWPQTVWSSMTSNGVNDWIGFSLETLDTKPDYNGPSGPAVMMPAMNAAQINVVMDPTDTDNAISMLTGSSPPPYLELFNEPDFSFDNLTPLTDPTTAAQNLSALFATPHPKTTFISPALMDANSDWLTTFANACNNCFDQIPIVAMHVYNPSPQGVMDQITQLHTTWPSKKIWITEISPATAGCTLTNTGTDLSAPNTMANYMGTLIPQILALGYVEKIFWNSGEWDSPSINSAPDGCNPSLVDANGDATDVLKSLYAVCGGGSGTTATSRRGLNFGRV